MSQPTPNGFVGDLFIEEILRKFLAYQFVQIAKYANDPVNSPIDELFARFGSDIREQIKLWFTTHTNIKFVINYPKPDLQIPFVGVVNGSENETGQPFIGDYGGLIEMGGDDITASSQLTIANAYGQPVAVPDNRPRAKFVRSMLSIPENRTTQVFMATDDANATMYVYHVIKSLIVLNKVDLDTSVGMRNLKMSGSDLQWREELQPTMGYMKQLTLNYETNFDVVHPRRGTIQGVDLALSAFLNGGSPSTVIE